MEPSSVAEGELVRIETPELENMVRGNVEEPRRRLTLEEKKMRCTLNKERDEREAL